MGGVHELSASRAAYWYHASPPRGWQALRRPRVHLSLPDRSFTASRPLRALGKPTLRLLSCSSVGHTLACLTADTRPTWPAPTITASIPPFPSFLLLRRFIHHSTYRVLMDTQKQGLHTCAHTSTWPERTLCLTRRWHRHQQSLHQAPSVWAPVSTHVSNQPTSV